MEGGTQGKGRKVQSYSESAIYTPVTVCPPRPTPFCGAGAALLQTTAN